MLNLRGSRKIGLCSVNAEPTEVRMGWSCCELGRLPPPQDSIQCGFLLFPLPLGDRALTNSDSLLKGYVPSESLLHSCRVSHLEGVNGASPAEGSHSWLAACVQEASGILVQRHRKRLFKREFPTKSLMQTGTGLLVANNQRLPNASYKATSPYTE